MGLLGWLFAAHVFATNPALLVVLDDFENPAAWHALHTDDVSGSLHVADGKVGKALRLDFDFAKVNGYVTAHRPLPLDLPDNYEFSFWVRGDAPVNNLQFKLIDASGDNVWWLNLPDFVFPSEWQQVRIKKRQLEFAWGPIRDRTLKHSAAIEFVVSSGRDGGKGSVYFDQLSLRELPPEGGPLPHPVLSASSALKDAPPSSAMDADAHTAWRTDPNRGSEQHLDIDLRKPREFGGLVVHWRNGEAATNYEVQFSSDSKRWRSVRAVHDGNGGDDALDLPESETRYLRLVLHAGQARGYGLNEIDIKDLAWGATPNAFFLALAKDAPRGSYPRGFIEQPYWTIVGIDGGPTPALISEDGTLEPVKGGFSIEPFLIVDGKLWTWADVTSTQSLLDGYLPIPTVEWKSGQLRMTIDAFASGTREQSRLVARYRVSNLEGVPLAVTLVLAVRPFQVNPPAQFLNTPGGTSPIHDLAWDGHAVAVNGRPRIWPLTPPERFFVSSFDEGEMPQRLTRLPWPTATAVHDEFGYASGALVYNLSLLPHGDAEFGLWLPMTGEFGAPPLGNESSSVWIDRQMQAVAADWRKKLNRVALKLPAQAQKIADTLRTALAHILMTRDGPALRPGTRSYARSWIRDGAMMADSLLRLDSVDAVHDYVEWYAPHQFLNGKVPCCVDWRGSDPIAENDSNGELIHVIAQLYRYAGNHAELEKNWPHVQAAVAYMDTLRESERNGDNRSGERRAFYGLMPASISHEGYSAKPMHSYWDDFWALAGYKDAVEIAQALGNREAVERFARSRDEFRGDLYTSIKRSVEAHSIDYLPGSAELGDFDATSTTVALSPAGEQMALPQDLLRNTFERYWRGFAERRDGGKPWNDYTPYEWRTVGAMVRLGWHERAQQAIDFLFVTGARPLAWNQWAEVVGRNARETRFVGDMPHGWVAADFICSALDLFVYERDADHALVLAAGVPATWLAGNGTGIDNLGTPYGRLRYTLSQSGKRVILHIAGGAHPPGGFVLMWPLKGPPGATQINGKRASWQNGELHIPDAPAEVTIEPADAGR
jgi:hypothetical protein